MGESKRERYIRLLKSKADLNFVELTFDAVKEIIELLEETSTEPEIIKCKDCKHHVLHPRMGILWCTFLHSDMGYDQFCSYAEKRGGLNGKICY